MPDELRPGGNRTTLRKAEANEGGAKQKKTPRPTRRCLGSSLRREQSTAITRGGDAPADDRRSEMRGSAPLGRFFGGSQLPKTSLGMSSLQAFTIFLAAKSVRLSIVRAVQKVQRR